jgi:hypothetical protein
MSDATSARPAADAPPASPADAPPTSGRDAYGRFAKGNRGGPGNPFARRTAGLRKAFCNALTQRQMRQLARSLHERALEGDTAAARLLLSYGVGRPGPAADPDTLDRHEVGVFAAAPEMLVEFQSCYKAMTPRVLAELARGLLPILAEAHRQDLAAKLREEPRPAGDDEDDEYGEWYDDEEDDYDDEDEDEDDEYDEDEEYGDERDETLTPEWRAALASVAPPPPAPPAAGAPAPAGADGRHSKSPKSAAKAPPGTAGPASARPAPGAAPRRSVPDDPPPAVNNRRDQRPPRPAPEAHGEGHRAAPGGPAGREIPPPRPGRNGSAKHR